MTTVLIVDGDESFATSAQTSLEAQGATVYVREDLPIDLIKKLRPEVLVIDIELPNAGFGFSICSKLRRQGLDTTRIMLTGTASSKAAFEKHSGTQHRADDYALKPLPPEVFAQQVIDLAGGVPQGGESPDDSDDSDFPSEEEDMPDSVLPPPLPKGEQPPPLAKAQSMEPPPMPTSMEPPPLKKGPPSLPSQDGPPPLKKSTEEIEARAPDAEGQAEVTEGAPAGRASLVPPPPPLPKPSEIFKPQSFDDLLREQVGLVAPSKPLKGTPEARVDFLRQQNKFLEAQKAAAREGWESLQSVLTDFEHHATSLRQEIQKRDTIILKTQEELERVSNDLEAKDSQFQDFQQRIESIFAEKDAEEQATISNLKSLEDKAEDLQTQLQSAQEQIEDDARRLSILQEELDSLHAENDELAIKGKQVDDLAARLQMTESVAEDRAAELADVQVKLETLVIETEARERHMDEDHQTVLNDLTLAAKAEQDALLDEIADLKSQSAEAFKHFKEQSDASRTKLEEDLEKAREQVFDLQQMVDNQTAELEDLRLRSAALENANTALSTQVDSIRTESEAAMDALEIRRSDELEEIKSHAESERADLEIELKEVRSELLKSRQETDRLSRRVDDLEATEAELRFDLDNERSEHARDLEEARAEADKVRGEHNEHFVILEERRERTERELEELRVLLEEKEEALANVESSKAAEMEGMVTELEDLRVDLAESRTEIDRLRENLAEVDDARAQAESLTSGVRGELEDTERRMGDMSQELEELRRVREDLEEQVFDVSAERDALLGSVEDLRAALQETETRSGDLAERVTLLEREQEEAREAASRYEMQVADAQMELQELRGQLETDSSTHGAEISERDAHIASLSSDKSALEQALAEKVDSLDELKIEAETLRSLVSELEEDKRSAGAVHESLTAQVETSQAKVDALENRVVALEEELELLEDERARNAERLELLAKANQSLAAARDILLEASAIPSRPPSAPPKAKASGRKSKAPRARASKPARGRTEPPPLPSKRKSQAAPPTPIEEPEELDADDLLSVVDDVFSEEGDPTQDGSEPFAASGQERPRRTLRPMGAKTNPAPRPDTSLDEHAESSPFDAISAQLPTPAPSEEEDENQQDLITEVLALDELK